MFLRPFMISKRTLDGFLLLIKINSSVCGRIWKCRALKLLPPKYNEDE